MPKKQKRYTRATDPLKPGKRYNPLGTKKDSERHQRTRDLKNEIHALKHEVELLKNRDANAHNRELEYLRQIASFMPSKAQREALDVICTLSVAETVALGATDAIVELCKWREEMRPRSVKQPASGKVILEKWHSTVLDGEKVVENRKVD